VKPKVPDNIRVFLSRKYLDWAEKLASKDSGIIHHLQTIRKHQRQRACETYNKTRLPEEINLYYLSFRLIEIFHLEEIDNLTRGLKSLFPGFSSYFGGENRFFSNLQSMSETISGTGYATIGYLSRKDARHLYPYHRKIESLPSEVEFIRIKRIKLWPSAMIITFDVHLHDEATSEIVALQKKHFLSEVGFGNLLPWKLTRSSSETPAMRKEILKWFSDLRFQVEQCIEPFISGFFMQHGNKKTTRLPAIEVFAFKGIPEEDEPIAAKWTEKIHGWWDSFGFKFYWPFYSNGQILFIESLNRPEETNTAYRLVALWDQYLGSITSQHMSTERETVSHNIRYVLDSLVPYISIHEFQATVQKELQKLRKIAFVSVHKGSQKLSKAIKLHNIISKEAMNLKRMAMEFRLQKKSILREMRALKDMKIVITSTDTDWGKNLTDALLENIEYQFKLLQKHISFLYKAFADYLTARNTAAMHKLQLMILCFTFIVMVATITSQGSALWLKIKEILSFFETVLLLIR
jgi:hypothetical protein